MKYAGMPKTSIHMFYSIYFLILNATVGHLPCQNLQIWTPGPLSPSLYGIVSRIAFMQLCQRNFWAEPFPNHFFCYWSKPWYLVNPKIAGKWMFIPLKMYLGIDPYPFGPILIQNFRYILYGGGTEMPMNSRTKQISHGTFPLLRDEFF